MDIHAEVVGESRFAFVSAVCGDFYVFSHLQHACFSPRHAFRSDLLAAPAWGQPVKQKWMDSTEKSTIEAEFVRLADAAVILKKDGKEISVPLTKLSLSSHLQRHSNLPSQTLMPDPAPKVIIGLPQTPKSTKLLENPFPANATVEQFMDRSSPNLTLKTTWCSGMH